MTLPSLLFQIFRGVPQKMTPRMITVGKAYLCDKGSAHVLPVIKETEPKTKTRVSRREDLE